MDLQAAVPTASRYSPKCDLKVLVKRISAFPAAEAMGIWSSQPAGVAQIPVWQSIRWKQKPCRWTASSVHASLVPGIRETQSRYCWKTSPEPNRVQVGQIADDDTRLNGAIDRIPNRIERLHRLITGARKRAERDRTQILTLVLLEF